MTPKEAEVCIVGGGVAASILASDLASRGVEVLILEAGPRHDPGKRYDYMRQIIYGDNPWDSDNPERDRFTLGASYPYPLNRTRVKALGGSGLPWGGSALRMHESDFELHSRYGLGVDWPIRYRDIEAYYTKAEKVIGVAGADSYPWTPWRSEPYPMPAFPFSYSDKILKRAFDRLGLPLHPAPVAQTSVPYDGRPACVSFAVCSSCPIFAKWTPDLLISKAEKTGKVTVKPETRVVRINCNRAGTVVESVDAATLVNGKPVHTKYRANIFVLAAHTVASTRLLLLSASPSHPQGLGNNSGYVGKYFMEHPVFNVTAQLGEKTYAERIGFQTSVSYYFYERSRRDGGTAFLVFPNNRHVELPHEIAQEAFRKDTVWGEELKAQVQNKFGYGASIEALIELLPYEENQITLDASVTDDLGLPVPKLTYSFEYARELHTIEKATSVLKQVYEGLDARDIQVDPMSFGAHHMGGCRMGDKKQSSVVNPDLRVHGIDNFYVVGSSVFPTSGAVTPTLTIAALALRLGDHLTAKMRRR